MMVSWRLFALLMFAGFWAQPTVQTVTTSVGAAQSAATSQSTAAPQNDAAGTSHAAAQEPATGATTGPVQPVPFSHKQHAGTLQLPCEFCHATSRSGDTLAIPQAALCMQCHQTIAANDPGVQKLAAYAKANTLIPWVRVYELPSFVDFSHKTHLLHGASCQQCHGSVAEQVQTYKAADLSMAACVNCHREKKASVDCNTCHMLDQ